MKRLFTMRTSRRGSALPVALVMAILLAALGTFLFAPIRDLGRLQSHEIARTTAHSLAESALDIGVHLLRMDQAPESATTGAKPIELGGTSAATTLELAPIEGLPSGWLITSTATASFGRSTVSVQAVAAIRLGEPKPNSPRPLLQMITGRTSAVADLLRR